MSDQPSEGAGFRIVGFVKRKRIYDRFAELSIDVPGERGQKIIKVRAFDANVIESMRNALNGARVSVIGRVDSEPVKNKAKEKIQVDGYDYWHHPLTATSVIAEQAPKKPANDNKSPLGDDKPGW